MGSISTRKRPGRIASAPLYLAIVACAALSPLVRAQTATVARPAKVTPPDTSPLARYVPKENLVMYLEFAGLDSHEAAWKNTASYKILNETTFGEVLGAVSEQLLDKVVGYVPSLKLTGSEIVTLVKHTARSGWVLALNSDAKARSGYRGTFVLRGGASKDNRLLMSRLMGLVMGASVRKVEKKEGRQLIVVTGPGAQEASASGWAWWAEKDDLVVGFMDPSSADSIIAALDGKTPNAVEHEVLKDLVKPEGKFEPVCYGFAMPAGTGGSSNGLATFLNGLKTEWGADRVDLRWGFESEALVTVTRFVTSKPRKGALAAFDGPTFDKTTLLPMPDQVNSFVETSFDPRHLLDLIKRMAPSSEVKEQIDEMAESLKTEGSIDLEKDVLGHLGPRMMAYLAPGGRSAMMTGDDPMASVLKEGWNPVALISALQSSLPKLTIVAEVKNPEAFSKALDAVIVALNKELKAQAIEKAVEERKEAEKKDESGRGGGGRVGGGNQTKTRRAPLQQTPAPRFSLTPTTGKAKVFVLLTPTGSPLQLGPKSFRPTIELDGNHVAFGVTQESAKNAIAAVRRTDWRPSGDLAKVCESVAGKLVFLAVSDGSDSLAAVLASLPGTLQTTINTTLALAKSGGGAAGNQPPGPPAGQAAEARGRGGPAGGGNPAGMGGRRGGGLAAPGGGGMGGPASRGGLAPQPGGGRTQAGSSATGSSGDSALVFNIDAEKLPKASDLKSFLFPSTIAISVTDQEIRITSRMAFPDIASLVNSLPALGMFPAAKPLLDMAQTPAAGEKPAAAGADTPPAAPPQGKAAAPGGGRRGNRAPR